MPNRPEVLAPAGDFECVRAAVENGADAVYFGTQKHNARARATNFALEELPDLFSFLHLRGVRGYVAFNTLIFSNELEEAQAAIEKIVEAGADALILQDFGVARLAREVSPDIALHASTQTTTTSAEQTGALKELGFSRVILARELSIADIRKVKAATDLPLEVFVHGALCVAYSGQCLTSEALGGRSANRGACAQACRLPYELTVDGEHRDLGDKKYLISPQDLAAYDAVPELVPLVSALKIEGRLKTPEYVAATTRAYRKAVDDAAAKFTRDEVRTLQQVFSRGFSHGFFDGDNHQTLVPGLSPKKRGVYLGRVTAVRGGRVQVALEAPLRPGDGVVFDYGRPEDEEPGGRVVYVNGDEFALRNCPPPKVGWKVWKTDDPAVNRSLRATYEKTGDRVPIDATVEDSGGMLRVTFDDGARRVVGEAGPLQIARNRPLTTDYLREHLGRLGDTPFALRNLDAHLGSVMVPVSQINDLRRRLAKGLADLRAARPNRTISSGALDRLREIPQRTSGDPRLVVLCRSMEQLQTALDEGIRHVECDFEDIRKYRDAVPAAHGKGATILLAPPRIFRPGESGILRNIAGAQPDGILARSTAHLGLHPFLVGDYSFNIANELTADWFCSKGLTRYVPSYDLNWEQMQALLKRTDPGRAEVVVHHQMPMFHMEHCVYAALLSKGKDCTDCGRPCDRHEISLEDRVGKRHPVKVDVGCRNTIYNAVPQSASSYVRGMLELGVRWFRIELLLHSAEEARRLIRGYQEVIEGSGDGRSLWKQLRASSFLGVTRGPLGKEE